MATSALKDDNLVKAAATVISRVVRAAILFMTLVVLSGCASPEERNGMVIEEVGSSCVVVPGGRAVLQIPVSLRDQDTDALRIAHLALLSADDLEIVGFILSPKNADQYGDQSPPPADVILAIEERGQDVQPVQELTDDGEQLLTILLEATSAAATPSAKGIRIEWNAGEPLFFQDTATSVSLESNTCELR